MTPWQAFSWFLMTLTVLGTILQQVPHLGFLMARLGFWGSGGKTTVVTRLPMVPNQGPAVAPTVVAWLGSTDRGLSWAAGVSPFPHRALPVPFLGRTSPRGAKEGAGDLSLFPASQEGD